MALIICPECKKEVSDKAKTCPSCGYPISGNAAPDVAPAIDDVPPAGEPLETECPAPESPAKNKKPIIAAICVVAVVLIASVCAIVVFNRADSRDEYIKTMESAQYTMLQGAAEAETTCNLISSVWYNTIFEKSDAATNAYTMSSNGKFHDDFNDSLSALLASDEYQEHYTKIAACQAVASDYMTKLQSPPSDLSTCYDTICDMYSEFSSFTDLAMSPKGSLQTFNQSYQDYDTSFMQDYNKLDTQIPED